MKKAFLLGGSLALGFVVVAGVVLAAVAVIAEIEEYETEAAYFPDTFDPPE